MDYRRRRTDVVRLRLFHVLPKTVRSSRACMNRSYELSTPLQQNGPRLALRLREQASQ